MVLYRGDNSEFERSQGTLSNGTVNGTVNGAEVLLEAIRMNPGRKIPFFVDLLGKKERTLRRYLAHELHARVEFRGAPKTGGYYIKEKE